MEKPLPESAISALHNGNKIGAIKIVREEYGLELIDSKALVEAHLRNDPTLAQRFSDNSTGGRFVVIVLLVLLVLVGTYLIR